MNEMVNCFRELHSDPLWQQGYLFTGKKYDNVTYKINSEFHVIKKSGSNLKRIAVRSSNNKRYIIYDGTGERILLQILTGEPERGCDNLSRTYTAGCVANANKSRAE